MSYVNYKIEILIQNNVIRETFDYVHHHSHQFFQDNLSGRISKQITILADNFSQLIHQHSRQIVRGIGLLIISLLTMYQAHFWFFCGIFTYFLLFSYVSLTYSKKLVSLSGEQASAESVVVGKLVDSLSNAQNVKLFSRLSYEKLYLEGYFTNVKIAFRKKEWFGICLHAGLGFGVVSMLTFMVVTLLYLRKYNLITIGDIALVLALTFEVAWMLWYTLEEVDKANKAIGKCTQALAFLYTPHIFVDDLKAKNLIISRGNIAFDKVSFHYKGVKPLFQDKSITIASGQKVGLVGYSGGGKSTFVNLILRLYDVSSGRILIDNQDIAFVTQDSLHEQIAMIPQDPSLFHRSLMDNIRYGNIDATNEEVIEAAKRAHAHEFIRKLPEGYESLVGERGIKLSGGQRQRIAIARAILKNAPILILDEATSQLDSVTEIEIQESLWRLMQNKTTLVIAHRLSTLLNMDRILVFNQGRIVEDGTHEELLSKGNLYKTLWDAQVGGFLPDKKSL